MRKANVKLLSLYTIWSYAKEEAWINEQSAKGLHLEEARFGYSSFTIDQSVRYTYRLDYRPDLKSRSGAQEYIDLDADAGWEHVCTCGNGWYYFRRPWQPGEAQVLFTDRTSLRQQYQQVQRVLGVIGISNMGLALINLNSMRLHDGEPPSSMLFILIFQLLVVAFLGRGYAVMNRKIKAIAVGA